MPQSKWAPSIVPNSDDQTVYMVLDCFGRIGCAWPEVDVAATDLETMITGLMVGQYSDPQRVVAFNTTEHWSEDVSADIAREIQRRADCRYEDISSSIESFVNRHMDRERQLALRLVP